MIRSLSEKEVRRSYADGYTISGEAIEGLPPGTIIGQERAVESLRFGISIQDSGFNIFVSGISGTGKMTAVKSYVEARAKEEKTPPDWCYVYNFQEPYEPLALSLPAGRAVRFKKDVHKLASEARQMLIRAFESEAFAERRKTIVENIERQQSRIFDAMNEKAEKQSMLIKQTPWTIATIPLQDGKPITEKQFANLSGEEQEKIRERQLKFQDEIKSAINASRKLEKEANEGVEALEKEVAESTIGSLTEEMNAAYADLPDIISYFNDIRNDILDNLQEFIAGEKQQNQEVPALREEEPVRRKYDVNVFVDNSRQKGAPVVIESNPTYNNLFGRVEKESMMGMLYTDFTLIRKGAFHSANGGYLIINVEELFRNMFSYDGMKRTLKNKKIVIEEAGEQLGFLTTKTIKPESIPLQLKLILVGNPQSYQLLYLLDNDFKELFKVKADFGDSMDASPENITGYARFITSLCQKENLLLPEPEAMGKITEYGSRLAEDQQKLSTQFSEIADIVREAGYYASVEQLGHIDADSVKTAVEQKAYRSGLVQEKIQELISRNLLRIGLSGKVTGQVNGVAVLDMGDIRFGKPVRITCTVNLGKEGIVAIEREAELSGPIHTKGILILTGFLSERFLQDIPVSLTSRLVFEQSYSEIEGDSASCAELYAILSRLSGQPIDQGICVTGSVNQKGEVQAIGGVNEKIEGYFEVCRNSGLTGEQGVIIPYSNIVNLMLKEEVVTAIGQKKFHVWAVDSVEEGITLLTGIPYGSKNEPGTIACMVHETLNSYAQKAKAFAAPEKNKDGKTS